MNQKEKAIRSVIDLFVKIFKLTSVPEILDGIPTSDKRVDLIGFQYAFIGALYMNMIKELVVPISALEDALKEHKAGTVEIEDIKRIIIETISNLDVEELWHQHMGTTSKAETPSDLS